MKAKPSYITPLTLKCAQAPEKDRLTVQRDGDGEVIVMVRDGDKAAFHYMSPEQARELFNWLGIYLHKL